MNPAIAGTLGRIAVTLLGSSWRIRRLRPETGIRGDGILYAFWHGVQLPLIYTHRNMGIRIMISRSADGSLVSAVCERMGFDPVRGSSSRGGITAARELIASLREGRPGAITPDGPRGPCCRVKKGVSLIPDRAGVPVVPYGVAAAPAIRLKSWDSFLIPLPFARLVVSEGRPVMPPFTDGKVIEAAISQQQARAELASDAVSEALVSSMRLAGKVLEPAATVFLRSFRRSEAKERLGKCPVRYDRPVWLHGASLGELKGLLPVLETLRKSDIPVHVTCTTPAGREYLEDLRLPVSYLPLDLPSPVERFLDRVSPRALILAETEIWPLLLYSAALRGIPMGMVNGRLSRKSMLSYRSFLPLFGGILNCFRIILTRSAEDSRRFTALGARTTLAGDMKAMVRPSPPPAEWSQRVRRGKQGILVAGSTREGEESLILDLARATGMTPVLVPRHSARTGAVAELCIRAGFKPTLWSSGEVDAECMLVDVRGVLASLYGIGDAAFVGGTLVPVGGHNLLEPLSHGVPLIVGPHHGHFERVVTEGMRMGICAVFDDLESGCRSLRSVLPSRGFDPGELLRGDFGAMLDDMLRLLEVNREDN